MFWVSHSNLIWCDDSLVESPSNYGVLPMGHYPESEKILSICFWKNSYFLKPNCLVENIAQGVQ